MVSRSGWGWVALPVCWLGAACGGGDEGPSPGCTTAACAGQGSTSTTGVEEADDGPGSDEAGAPPSASTSSGGAIGDASTSTGSIDPTLSASTGTSSGGAASEGSETTADADDDDRCDVGVYDPEAPPRSLALTGHLGAHDPVIMPAHGQYYYFSTGNGIATKTSPDLLAWTQGPEVFPETPAWFQERVPAYEPRNVWAPDISYFGGQYHLYYSVSSFGDNRSCIGHATRPALDTGAWTDHREVICSNLPGEDHDWNAIDPNVVLDEDGTPWMSFGSFWDGIKMIQLDLEGNRASDALHDIASRGGSSIEAPFIVRRCGYYYLFVSFGSCCQGVDSTYNINVGRAETVLGPYVDREGRAMLEGGGTLLLQGGGAWVGPGHNAVLLDGDRAYNVYHAYAASNGAAELRISELVWDEDGWPITAGP